MSIGLYIPCFNAEAYLDRVITAVLKQSLKPQEILIIDDASTDRTHDIAAKYPVKIIRHVVNQGLASARNTALANMQTKYIASLDADCIADSDWLSRLCEKFTDQDIVGIGGKLRETYTQTVCDQWRAIHMPQSWALNKDPEFLFGSNTVFRRSALLEVKGYDQQLKNNYEDVDICRRLKARGYKITYDPDAVVSHLKQDTAASLLNTYWKWRHPYYKEQGFYQNQQRLMFKIKDNIGLANRYLQQDITLQQDISYIDFLLAFDHCVRDFIYYIKQQGGKSADLSRSSLWLALHDLNFFYRFNKKQLAINTLLPKEHIITQNVLALILILGRTILERFGAKEFSVQLWNNIFECLFQIKDEQLSEQLFRCIERSPDWKDFLIKEHKNLDIDFLSSMSLELNRWFNSLIHNQPDVLFKIRNSARKLY